MHRTGSAILPCWMLAHLDVRRGLPRSLAARRLTQCRPCGTRCEFCQCCHFCGAEPTLLKGFPSYPHSRSHLFSSGTKGSERAWRARVRGSGTPKGAASGTILICVPSGALCVLTESHEACRRRDIGGDSGSPSPLV